MSNMSVSVSVGFDACGMADRGDSLAMNSRCYCRIYCIVDVKENKGKLRGRDRHTVSENLTVVLRNAELVQKV